MNWLARLFSRVLRHQANVIDPRRPPTPPPTTSNEVRVTEVNLETCGCGCGVCQVLFHGTDARGACVYVFALPAEIAGRLGDGLVGAKVSHEVRAGRN